MKSTNKMNILDDEQKAIYPQSQYENKPTIYTKWIGGSYILSLLIVTIAYGFYVVVPVMLIGTWIAPTWTQYLYRRVLGLFCAYVCGVFEYLNGMQVVVTGENGETFQFKETDRVLLISNHRTEIDWLLHW